MLNEEEIKGLLGDFRGSGIGTLGQGLTFGAFYWRFFIDLLRPHHIIAFLSTFMDSICLYFPSQLLRVIWLWRSSYLCLSLEQAYVVFYGVTFSSPEYMGVKQLCFLIQITKKAILFWILASYLAWIMYAQQVYVLPRHGLAFYFYWQPHQCP